MRKHETQWGPGAIDQFRYDRLEIVPVGTEAVQPDHGMFRVGGSFDFDGG